MIPIRFNDLDSKKRALDRMAGRYSVKNCPTAEMYVPEAALADLATEGLDFQVIGSAAPRQDFGGPLTFVENPSPDPASSYLVRIRRGPDGQVTAHLPGAPDLQATAATPESAVEQLRARVREELNLGSLLAIEMPRENPLIKWAGAWKDDPSFDAFLEEMRKFRAEEDRLDGYVTDADECSDTSSTPTN